MDGRCFGSFLYRGRIRASHQSAGTQLSSSESWYIQLSIGDISSAAALRIKVGIPSGPADLNERSFLSSFFTPFELMMMLPIDENGLGPLSGMLSGCWDSSVNDVHVRLKLSLNCVSCIASL